MLLLLASRPSSFSSQSVDMVDGEREVRAKKRFVLVKNEWCFSRGYVTRRRSLSRPRNTSRSPSRAFSMYARARASARSRLATQTFSEL